MQETKTRSGASLRVAGLEKRFVGVLAVAGVDLQVDPGETVGVFGPNGSGKTTLVNCISGVFPATAGEIYFDDRPISRTSREARARSGLVRTYQNLRLFPDLTVLENIEAGLSARREMKSAERRRRLADALDEQGLTDYAERRVADLPYGLQKRAEIARALIAEPRVLLLDEPAAGLGDEEGRLLEASLKRARERLGFAMLLIDHNVRFVSALATRLVVLADGKIIRSGEPSAILGDAEVVRIYFGGPVVAAG
jgi:branched-chain amino acid transport system ATP-binding protein